jgi:hypothetical protein
MASSGPNAPGTIVNDTSVGTRAWNNPTNAASSDNVYTTSQCAFPTCTSQYLKATNFGFSFAMGDTIDGIVVEFERKASANAPTRYILDSTVKLVIGGSVVGTNKNSITKWSTTEAFFTYGGAADLWGNTITPTDVNSSNFGVVLSVSLTDTGKIPNMTASVDYIRITVYYTTGGGGGGSVSKLGLLGVG